MHFVLLQMALVIMKVFSFRILLDLCAQIKSVYNISKNSEGRKEKKKVYVLLFGKDLVLEGYGVCEQTTESSDSEVGFCDIQMRGASPEKRNNQVGILASHSLFSAFAFDFFFKGERRLASRHQYLYSRVICTTV